MTASTAPWRATRTARSARSWRRAPPARSRSPEFVGGTTPGQHVNVFTAKAVDNDNTEATDTDDATVDILATTSKIAPTQTTCEQYRDGTAVDYTELTYNVSKGKIGSVSPGVIFFWSTITAPGAVLQPRGASVQRQRDPALEGYGQPGRLPVGRQLRQGPDGHDGPVNLRAPGALS